MVEQDMVTIFNECIDLMARGASLEDCLNRYPDVAESLRPMLEAGLLVKRAMPVAAEVVVAQQRGLRRFEDALSTPIVVRSSPYRRLLSLAAVLVLAFVTLFGGAVTASQPSLPGDPLYGIKRLGEQLQLSLGGNPQQFAQRRLDEIRQLLAINRAAEVEFEGEVQVINGNVWLVAGLPVMIDDDTQGAEGVIPGDQVHISAFTTSTGELLARVVTIIRKGPVEPTVIPSPTSLSTLTPTSTATLRPSTTPSVTPSLTVTASLTPTPTPSVTPSLTVTATLTRTVTPSITPTPSVTVTAVCIPVPPAGWVRYTIQIGDTLSGLAASRGVTMEQVMAVNCLSSAAIIAGQNIYLPPGSGNSGSGSGNSGSGGSNSGSGSSNSGSGGSGSGGDNSNDNDDDGGDDNGGDDDGGDD